MANGLKRISNVFRNAFDMDDGDVAAFRSRVTQAAESAEPVRKGDLKAKLIEYRDLSDKDIVGDMTVDVVFNDTPAGDFLADLSGQVQDAIDAMDDWSGEDEDEDKVPSSKKLLTAARAENKRADRGLDLRGCGEYPQLLWNRARRIAQRVDDGLISEKRGLELVGRRDLHEDTVRELLGRFLAAYETACDEFGKLAKADREAGRRAREHRVVGRINIHDNQRRMRIAGRDPTPVLAEEITKALAKATPELIKAIMDGMSKTELQRPAKVVELEVE